MLRVDATTIYRAIREDAFPALRIRGRYIVPARALEAMVEEVAQSGRTFDIAAMAVTRKVADAAKRLNL